MAYNECQRCNQVRPELHDVFIEKFVEMTGKPLFNDEIQVFSYRVINRAYKIMKMMLQHFSQSQEQEVVVEKMRDNII